MGKIDIWNFLMKRSYQKKYLKNYSKKLKDPRWQKKRLDIFLRDDWNCQNCGNKDETLHVHHKVYRRSDPWDVPSSDLITLCESCHEVETFNRGDVEIRFLRSLKKFGMLTSHLESLSEYFESINQYVDSLEDEKWSDREKELLKAAKACFICHTQDNLIIYHKSPSCIIHKPWELPSNEFDFICKSCNRNNEMPNILYDFLEFLLPAFLHAGYYREDIVDMVSDDYLRKFIRLVLEEIRKTRMEAIPSQFSDDWIFRRNITYEQLNSLNQKADRTTEAS